MSPFLVIFILCFIVLFCCCYYVFQRRKNLDEMHGMMVGMTFGMMAGLVSATLYLLPTGDFLWGTIIGSVIGLVFGIPLGRLGGHMGLMEGVMAGPMGGMMGAMLGQMMRPFNIEIFMPFFMFLFLITMLGICYSVHCGADCCGGKKKPGPVSRKFIVAWSLAAIVLLGVSVDMSFALTEKSDELVLPPGLRQAAAQSEVKAEAVLKEGIQEIELVMENSQYSPNVILAKKGIPLRINIIAKETAGCASELVIPDFNIKKIVGPGSTGVVEIQPDETGTFKFRCSMDMARGKIVVQ